MEQLIHYFTKAKERASDFFYHGNEKYYEYWKGQCMGIIHSLDMLNIKHELTVKDLT